MRSTADEPQFNSPCVPGDAMKAEPPSLANGSQSISERDPRYRITIRGDDPVIELRGYVDHWSVLERLCSGLQDYFGNTVTVIASTAEDGYDPFT